MRKFSGAMDLNWVVVMWCEVIDQSTGALCILLRVISTLLKYYENSKMIQVGLFWGNSGPSQVNTAIFFFFF